MRTRTVVRNPRTLTPLTIVLLAMIFIMLFVALGQKWIEGVLKDIWYLFSGA
jgi:hypothetical protein